MCDAKTKNIPKPLIFTLNRPKTDFEEWSVVLYMVHSKIIIHK